MRRHAKVELTVPLIDGAGYPQMVRVGSILGSRRVLPEDSIKVLQRVPQGL